MNNWTEEQAEAHAKENNRTCVLVYQEPDESFTAYYQDERGVAQKFRHTNAFGLDSLISEAGVPSPRNLYLISNEE